MPVDYGYYMLGEGGVPIPAIHAIPPGYPQALYAHAAYGASEAYQEPREEPVGFFSGREAGESEFYGFGDIFGE